MDESFLVSVFDVRKDNLQMIWPCLVFAIQNSSFVAIDCELSGLGNRKLINSQAVDDRYKNISEVARSRSIISIGLSCFNLEDCSSEEKTLTSCKVQTFNLMALCSEDYIVEPSALQFLVNHGFDFQKQYSQGIPYYRGLDKEIVEKSKHKLQWNLRDVFGILVSAKVPLIFHNGMVDLIFLYQNFYSELPANLATFVADVEMMFPNGIYDTKYVAEFSLRMSSSFLEYVFRSHQLKNLNKKNSNQPHLVCHHTLPDSDFIDIWDCSPRLQDDADLEICKNYICHGFCPNRSLCKKSHDVFRAILLEDQKNKSKKRKRTETPAISNLASLIVSESSLTQEHFKGHRAGHDAFMTGFSFASFVVQKLGGCGSNPDNEKKSSWTELLADVRNRICLSGKDLIFLFHMSVF